MQLLERALEECGNDIDAAIKSLRQLCLGSAEKNSDTTTNPDAPEENSVNEGGDAAENSSATNNLPGDGAEWVELFVKEMMCATSLDDARARVTRILELLEKSISAHAGAEAVQTFEKVSYVFMSKFISCVCYHS